MQNKLNDLKEKLQKEGGTKTNLLQGTLKVDLSSPCARNYKIEQNTLTLLRTIPNKKNGALYGQMLLVDVEVGESFSFRTHIVKTLSGVMAIGVADRVEASGG